MFIQLPTDKFEIMTKSFLGEPEITAGYRAVNIRREKRASGSQTTGSAIQERAGCKLGQ